MVGTIARETARRRRHRFQTREFASSLGAPAASRHRDPPLFIREFDHVSTRLVAAGTRRDVRLRDLVFGPLLLVVPVSSRFRRPNERTLNRGGGRTPRERRKFHRYKRRTQKVTEPAAAVDEATQANLWGYLQTQAKAKPRPESCPRLSQRVARTDTERPDTPPWLAIPPDPSSFHPGLPCRVISARGWQLSAASRRDRSGAEYEAETQDFAESRRGRDRTWPSSEF